MLEAKHFTGPTEASLNFVHRQHDVVLPTEFFELPCIFHR